MATGMETLHMTESRKGSIVCSLQICSSEFSIASGGAHKVKLHVESKRHSELARGMTSQSTLTGPFRGQPVGGFFSLSSGCTCTLYMYVMLTPPPPPSPSRNRTLAARKESLANCPSIIILGS